MLNKEQALNKFHYSLFLFQVTLQLQPMFKRSLTFVTHSDEDLAEQAVNFGHQHEFADLAWYPGHRKVLYRNDDRVPVNTSGHGVYDFIGFRSTPTLAIEIPLCWYTLIFI